jgi:hypothetical protein
MIEHTLYYMGKFLFVRKFQHVHELWPTEVFARPGQILGQLQFKTMYLYASKTTPIRPFDMISSSKQVFIPFGQGCCIFKSQTKFDFDQVIVQNQSWTICWSDLAGEKNRKQTRCHDFF